MKQVHLTDEALRELVGLLDHPRTVSPTPPRDLPTATYSFTRLAQQMREGTHPSDRIDAPLGFDPDDYPVY